MIARLRSKLADWLVSLHEDVYINADIYDRKSKQVRKEPSIDQSSKFAILKVTKFEEFTRNDIKRSLFN